ncbi:MAG: hypothetical protein R3A48_26505 [Polyangiales bacterium]
MSRARFPFRFYGREPADWSPALPNFVYELQFERPLSEAQRDAVLSCSARMLAEGPASPGPGGWWWSGDRFALLCVGERYTDAPRMVFGRVAQLLGELHRVAKLRDVVFSNAWGARSEGWDAWSRERQAEPDAGPPAPQEASLAQALRRAVDPSLAPYTQDVLEVAAPPAAPPARDAHAESAPQAKAPTVRFEEVDRYNYPEPQPEDLSAFLVGGPDQAGKRDEVIHAAAPPLARVMAEGRAVAIAHIDDDGERVETPFPEGAPPSGPAGTDIEGLRAMIASENAVYELHLGEAAPKWRMAIHLNNGLVRGLAWVCDNLWAVLVDRQVLVDDLSGATPMYVGAALVQGTEMTSTRHGTILVVHGPRVTHFVGVCDWQIKVLATRYGDERFAYESGGELIFRQGVTWVRAAGLIETYEAWAAPLRKRAETCRKRRFANGRARRPPAKPHWIHVEEIPRWAQQDRWDAVREALPDKESWCSVAPTGAAVTVRSKPGAHWSRHALLGFTEPDGEARPLRGAVQFAAQHGVTNLSLSPDGRSLWVVDGLSFNVHRVDVDACEDLNLGSSPFLVANGFLVDVIALGADDLVALWVDALIWLRRKGSRLVVVHRLKMNMARGFAYDPASRRLIVTAQDPRGRLLVVRAEGDALRVEAKLLDGVKEAMFRAGEIYATMTDGVRFVLRGLA